MTKFCAYSLAALSAMGLSLAGCGTPITSQGPTPVTGKPPLVTVVEPTNAPEAAVTPTADQISLPTSTPVLSATAAECEDPAMTHPAPELATLSWESATIGEQQMRQLSAFDAPLLMLDPSPDNRWIVVALNTAPRVGRAAVAVIDTQSNNHWWVDRESFLPTASSPTAWLPNGRLLWVNEQSGKVFLGSDQDHRDLNAPVPMGGIRYAADDIALAVNSGDLWRVALGTGQWEKVSSSSYPEATGLGNYYGISHDGSYALSFQSGLMWRVPTALGTDAERLPGPEVQTVGSGSPSEPPLQLADTPYWLIDLPLVPSEEAGPKGAAGFIVNIESGRLLTADDLALPTTYALTAYSASPDGRWIAVSLWDRDRQQPAGLYVAPASTLTEGRLVDGLAVAGWNADAPALLLREATTHELIVAGLPLSDEEERVTLRGAGELVAISPTTIFASEADNPARLLQFGMDGTLLKTLDLSAAYSALSRGAAAGDRLYVSATQEDGAGCTYDLIEWTTEP